MGQIIKSLGYVILSFCQSVCKHSYGHNFDSILMKFCTVIRRPKCKIDFVWGKNRMTPSPIFFDIFVPTMHLQCEGFHTTVNKLVSL